MGFGFNISEFASSVSEDGILKPNKFLVSFLSPAVLQGFKISNISQGEEGLTNSSDIELLNQMRASDARLPGVSLRLSDNARYGNDPFEKMPYNVDFTSTNVTFICDRYGDIYRYFYLWFNKIFDFSGTIGNGNVNPSYLTAYKDDIITDLHVVMFDDNGNLVKDIVMFKAFPISINEIPLSWSDNNSYVKLVIEFTFKTWAMVGVGLTK